ncbi:M23 family metallopeptidase [Nocardia sp. CDC159]|uniref:M23 family metallopeptidase n=1 Tax=Nocardia pulmonis TaxID=2951408 RepID=A0A9X2IXK0_9NOCA|nr:MULTISPECIES: M23 family metallopeptidase [Nocardia]MCM6772931.1 M23 family metallopeptidase [Nocardia pulmonis]MCM6785766.1 M23 family metallopeptidase [Nocardia sp. CDC159]
MPDQARRAKPYEGGWTVIRPDWRSELRRSRHEAGREHQPGSRRGRGWVAHARRLVAQARILVRRLAAVDWREYARRDWRAYAREQWPPLRAWLFQHRVLLAGLLAIALFAAADTIAPRPVDGSPPPGTAQRVPVAYPLQVRAPAESSRRFLNAINNGERLREAQVVAAAARATLERAKAEAAAAVAGEAQPWINGPVTTLPGAILPNIGGFVLPARGVFTSGYGQRWGTFHWGIDIAAPIGSPIYAVADGVVIDAGPAQGFGLWVRVRHNDGSVTVYGHMYDFSVSVGERVRAGQQIARVGNRGDSTGPHLHFEVLVGGRHVDPQPWLALHGLRLG